MNPYANVIIGRNLLEGVATGPFNFDPDELNYINHDYIVLEYLQRRRDL
jgi:hypothetical protein